MAYIYIVKVLFDASMQREINDKNRATMTSVGGLFTEVFALLAFGLVAVTSQFKSYTFGLQATACAIALLALLFGLLKARYKANEF